MILPPDAYQHVFSRWNGAKAALFADSGNPGDRIIRIGELVACRYFNIQLIRHDAPEKPDVVFWGGGGNMGSIYPYPREERAKALAHANKAEVPVVVLPQSWMSFCNYPTLHNYVREIYSMRFRPSGVLAPDLGLLADIKSDVKPTKGTGYLFRVDQEAPAMPRTNHGDPSVICHEMTPQEYVDFAASYEIIHTNRLHFAVAGMLARREVVLYPNSYHKNRGVYELWLHGRGCEWREEFP